MISTGRPDSCETDREPSDVCRRTARRIVGRNARGRGGQALTVKVTVCFERRPDGGLRAWSDDVPSLVLSHKDVDGALDDVKNAIETILSHRLSPASITVRPLDNLRDALEKDGIVDPELTEAGPKEYVAYCH